MGNSSPVGNSEISPPRPIRALPGASARSVSRFTFISAAAGGITTRWVTTAWASARMPAPPGGGQRRRCARPGRAVDRRQIVVPAVAGQHDVGASAPAPARVSISSDVRYGMSTAPTNARSNPARRGPQSQAGGRQRPEPAHLVPQHLGVQRRQHLARSGDDEHRGAPQGQHGHGVLDHAQRAVGCRIVALSRPILRDSPPASTTPASGPESRTAARAIVPPRRCRPDRRRAEDWARDGRRGQWRPIGPIATSTPSRSRANGGRRDTGRAGGDARSLTQMGPCGRCARGRASTSAGFGPGAHGRRPGGAAGGVLRTAPRPRRRPPDG